MSDPNPKAKAEEPIGCVPILKPIAASHGLYVVAVCLAHGYKEPESLPCPLCERAAREEVQELERLCKSEIDLLNAMSIPWKHRDGPVNGVDGCACIACELHRVYQKELAALKLKLEVANGAFGKLLSEISERTHKHYDKREASFVGNVVCLNSTLEAADEALSRLNGADDGESQPPSTAKGTLKAFEQIVNATPFPEGKEMIQTGQRDATSKVLLTKEQKPRTRTLLRSMLAAFDRGDSDTYWATFGILLEVHKEVMSADTKGTST